MDVSYAFTGITEFFRYLVYAELIGVAAAATCLSSCCAIRAARHRADRARQHRHAEAALRAEVNRGLAEIEQDLRRRSADAAPPKPDTGNGGSDCPHDAEPGQADSAGSKGERTR